jgi:nitrate/nitrite transporter NarK
MDPQIALFCFLYFSISLTIYGATFWLPSIIAQMGDLGDFQIGLFNSIPWLISVGAMYAFAMLASRFRWQQAWASSAFFIAAIGMMLSTTGGPITMFVSICFAAIGFKAASSLFWPIPQSYLDARIAAPIIALVNSVGSLGGFVAPTTFGFFEERTGSVNGGMIALAVVAVIAGVLVHLTKVSPELARAKKQEVATAP